MARTYAGILGVLAMITTLLRGGVGSAGSETLLLKAWGALVLFAAVGYAIGWIANRTVEDSVRAKIEQQAASASENASQKPS